jgi:hypothetical protein
MPSWVKTGVMKVWMWEQMVLAVRTSAVVVLQKGAALRRITPLLYTELLSPWEKESRAVQTVPGTGTNQEAAVN